MRKLSLLLIAAALAFPGAASAQKSMAGATQKKDEPNISAPHAILIEAQSGSVLFERAADDLILDGEALVADSRGVPDFGLLHADRDVDEHRGLLTRRHGSVGGR